MPTITSSKTSFKEIKGGLFTTEKPPNSVILLPVNAYIKSNGKAVMAQGCALAAKQKYKGIDLRWGQELERQGRMRGNRGLYKTDAVGNIPAIINDKPIIVACPTQWHFVEKSDLSLIERSIIYIVTMADFYRWTSIFLPEIGCGAGGRSWKYEIKPILKNYLDGRFTVCHLTNE
jgi:hypothetical protein